MFRKSMIPLSKQRSIQNMALEEESLNPSVIETNTKGNLERQNTIIQHFDISRIKNLTEKCDRQFAIVSENKLNSNEPNPKKKIKMNWKFLSKNTQIVTKKDEQLLGFDPTKEIYEHYTEVPSTDEIYRYLLNAKRARQIFAASKKSEFDKFQEDREGPRDISFTKLAQKEKAAKQQETMRRLSRRHKDDELQQIVDIVRKPVMDKTRKECMMVRDWILSKSRKTSIIHTFLQQLQDDPHGEVEALEFVRGLKYKLFNRKEAIIRQNATGYAYFILLSGRVKVHVNRNLWSDEIANERAEGRLGIGQCVDTCEPGAVCHIHSIQQNLF